MTYSKTEKHIIGFVGCLPLIALGVILLLMLGGCGEQGSTGALQPVCEALDRPIEYNSKNPKSNYYAAKLLAPQLATRNRTGVNLGCKAYQ